MYSLGIDTSNYKTSIALYDEQSQNVIQHKMPLPVKPGEVGLRQSDAVFLHIKNFLSMQQAFSTSPIQAIGVSTRPRDREGSYMPCFLVGEMLASALGQALQCPVYSFSHQMGHIYAALYGAEALSICRQSFFAFHFSGGTTEVVEITPGEDLGAPVITERYHSLDLKAGQAIDRIGNRLNLSFPAGPEMEQLAAQSQQNFRIHLSMKEGNPSLSGLQNQCERMIERGEPRCDVAWYCLSYIRQVVWQMIKNLREEKPEYPILFSGGVMSNRQIQQFVQENVSNVYFSPADFSADNAAGIALLAHYSYISRNS